MRGHGAGQGDGLACVDPGVRPSPRRDPDIARILRPTTLRAKFGRDKVHCARGWVCAWDGGQAVLIPQSWRSQVRSAVHCTDLDEDCNLEIDYFFRIMTAPTPNL